MEFGREKMCHVSNEKPQTIRQKESNYQIRTLGAKETYKYLALLKADTIKQVDMREKMFKRVSQENQNATRDKTIAGTLSKKCIAGQS